MTLENKFTNWIYQNSPIWLQNSLVTYIGILENRSRFNNEFEKYSEFLTQSKKFSVNETLEYQHHKLRKLISHAYKTVPYYYNLFKDLGLKPNDVKNEADLKKLPMLTKEMLTHNSHLLISRNIPRRELILVHTSGTTGTALKFMWTRTGLAREFAFIWSRRRSGVSINDLHASFNARKIVPIKQQKPPFWRINRKANQILFSQYHISSNNALSYLNYLNEQPFIYYDGYPSSLYLLADLALQNAIEIRRPPVAIYTSSETLLKWQKSTIENIFKTKIIDSYGSAEQGALAVQCDYQNYHFIPEYGIVELIPIAKEGDLIKAEIISTSFLNYGMPMIRYRLNDHVLMSKDKKCLCGFEGAIIKQIDGRIEDSIITPNGSLIGRMDHIFKDLTKIRESQIVQYSPEEIIIKIVRRHTYDKSEEKALLNKVKDRVGKEMKIQIKYVNFIERTSYGKFRAVISDINKPKS